MNRLVMLALSLGCLAACGGSAHRKTVGATGGTLGGASITISPAAPDADFGTVGFDDRGALPAISADGTLVAALFHDTTDFVGLPVDTLVVWRIADGKRVAQVASSDGQPPSDDAPVDPSAGARKAAEANAALAGHTWIHASGSPTAVPHEDGEGADVTLGDGRVVTYAEGALTLPSGRLEPDGFAAPGDGMEDDDGGGCGAIFSVRVLAGGRAGDDWMLLEPDGVQLGGDSCMGKLTADLAQVVHVRE